MKLIDALRTIESEKRLNSNLLEIALVCGFTPLHLQTFLHAQLLQLFPEHRVEIRTGLFGDIPGSLKRLQERPVSAVAMLLEWQDLDARLGLRQLGGWTPRNLEDIAGQVQLKLSQLKLLIENLERSVSLVISLPTLPLPPLFFTSGWQANTWELKLRELLSSFAVALDKPGVRFVNEQRLALLSPPSERLSVKSDWTAGFPYQLQHASALAESLARLIRDPLPMKGIITDLDDTLWSGIVGEVGVQSIHWDLDHHSQGHGLYQQFLSTLADEGVLVGLASKNDPQIVEEVFAQRDDLLLPKASVFPVDVSWGSKAKAVSRILEVWNIGADSVVFIDDNPLELAEVQASQPRMKCLQFPHGNPEDIYGLLVQLRDLFGKSRISAEDEIRRESIRSNAAWQAASEDSAEGFSEALLEQADAELTLKLDKDASDSRALELINKTNQFNLNGCRFTDSDWKQYLEGEGTFLLTVSYKDRFGPLGEIAVLTGRANEVGLSVESWVLSCRAFARRIEHHCLKFLFDKFGINQITFAYRETPRNSPVRMFFAQFLPGDLPPRLEISRAQFSELCPRLFHSIRELNDE